MISILKNSKNKEKWMYIVGILVWLLIWQGVAMWLQQEILLVSPISVCKRLFLLCKTLPFWQEVGNTLFRIIIGFLFSIIMGLLFAFLSFFCLPIRIFLKPAVQLMKTAPVASIIIVILIWIPSSRLSFIISFFVAFPLIYTNVLMGLEQTPKELVEVMAVYQASFWTRLKYLYITSILPYLQSSVCVGIGMSIKASIAAEIIGLPKGTIGERMYQAKIYLNTPDLFAWTLVVILLSILLEYGVKKGMNQLVYFLHRTRGGDQA